MATIVPGGRSRITSGRFQRCLHLDDDKYDYLVLSIKNFISEVFATGILVFLGCMGVVRGLGQVGDHTGVALSFSMAVFTAIQIGIHNSGGHVNPAVTIVGIFFKKVTIPMAVIYILGQLLGSILGFGLLILITPSKNTLNAQFEEYGLCTTVPHPEMGIVRTMATEFALTSILMLLVCSAWDPRNAYHDSITLKLGFTVYSLAYSGVAYSGCSMNPARSLGPAVWNNSWKDHWIYWVSPLSAAAICGFFYTAFFCPKIEKPQLRPADA